jgi:ribonucleoside-triphosphate reductase (thioredoxin)
LHDSYEEYERTLKFAYLYAKTVTLIPTHNERTNAIMLRNRRIGLSQSGIVESFEKHGRRTHFDWCDKGYQYICKLDKIYADWLCIPESIKKTSVKPSGTVSLLPGVTPGIHYPHAEYYYRTIRIDKTSPLIDPIRRAGYRIEESVYGDNTWVVYFPVHQENFERSKDDVSVWEQMENVAQMQYYWADNQVSATITFTPEEANDIPKILELYEPRLKSISFLPLTDHNYAQAPYQTITRKCTSTPPNSCSPSTSPTSTPTKPTTNSATATPAKSAPSQPTPKPPAKKTSSKQPSPRRTPRTQRSALGSECLEDSNYSGIQLTWSGVSATALIR